GLGDIPIVAGRAAKDDGEGAFFRAARFDVRDGDFCPVKGIGVDAAGEGSDKMPVIGSVPTAFPDALGGSGQPRFLSQAPLALSRSDCTRGGASFHGVSEGPVDELRRRS